MRCALVAAPCDETAPCCEGLACRSGTGLVGRNVHGGRGLRGLPVRLHVLGPQSKSFGVGEQFLERTFRTEDCNGGPVTLTMDTELCLQDASPALDGTVAVETIDTTVYTFECGQMPACPPFICL